MNRIDRKFQELGRTAFIAFIVAGDPDVDRCIRIAKTIIDAGADILELGVPFSDPVADGPTIQKADERALNAGTNMDMVFSIVREIRAYSDIPITLLTYYNPVYRRGVERFYKDAHELGVDGVLVADMPVEEANDVLKASEIYDIDQIFLVAQTTTEARLKKIIKHARGFLYLVSVLGVTGARGKLSQTSLDLIKFARSHTKMPLAIGFGISEPEHIKKVTAAGADAAIVGSAIVNMIEHNSDDAMRERIREYIATMIAATEKNNAKIYR